MSNIINKPPKNDSEILSWRNWVTLLLTGRKAVESFIAKVAKFGNTTTGDYSEFEADGTYIARNGATTFDDLQGSILSLKQKGPGLSTDDTENTVVYTTGANLDDYLYDNYQVRHKWLIGSDVFFHIHFEQAQNNTPNLLMRYRWQQQGEAKTVSWTDYPLNTLAFTYTSGTLDQLIYGSAITPPANAGLSDILQVRIFRDNSNTSGAFAGSDPYTASVALTFADFHIEEDTLGSRSEFAK